MHKKFILKKGYLPLTERSKTMQRENLGAICLLVYAFGYVLGTILFLCFCRRYNTPKTENTGAVKSPPDVIYAVFKSLAETVGNDCNIFRPIGFAFWLAFVAMPMFGVGVVAALPIYYLVVAPTKYVFSVLAK